MINKNLAWIFLILSVTVISGCLTGYQSALVRQAIPYAIPGGYMPQRSYTSANTLAPDSQPQRAFTAQRAFTSRQTAGANCFQNIDRTELERVSEQSKQFNAEIKVLCEKGQRDKATKKAAEFGRKMAHSKVMTEMKKCGTTTSMTPPETVDVERDIKYRHICDSVLTGTAKSGDPLKAPPVTSGGIPVSSDMLMQHGIPLCKQALPMGSTSQPIPPMTLVAGDALTLTAKQLFQALANETASNNCRVDIIYPDLIPSSVVSAIKAFDTAGRFTVHPFTSGGKDFYITVRQH